MSFFENRRRTWSLVVCLVLSACGFTLIFKPYLHECLLLPTFSTVVCALVLVITRGKSDVWKFSGMLVATTGTAWLFSWRPEYIAAVAAVVLALTTTVFSAHRALTVRGVTMKIPFAMLAIAGLAAGLAVLYGVTIARTFHYAGTVYALICVGAALAALIDYIGDYSWN